MTENEKTTMLLRMLSTRVLINELTEQLATGIAGLRRELQDDPAAMNYLEDKPSPDMAVLQGVCRFFMEESADPEDLHYDPVTLVSFLQMGIDCWDKRPILDRESEDTPGQQLYSYLLEQVASQEAAWDLDGPNHMADGIYEYLEDAYPGAFSFENMRSPQAEANRRYTPSSRRKAAKALTAQRTPEKRFSRIINKKPQ